MSETLQERAKRIGDRASRLALAKDADFKLSFRTTLQECDLVISELIEATATALAEKDAEIERLREEVEALTSVRQMTVARLGGEVDGRPTHWGNFLQRIDELRNMERGGRGQRSALARLDEAVVLMREIKPYLFLLREQAPDGENVAPQHMLNRVDAFLASPRSDGCANREAAEQEEDDG